MDIDSVKKAIGHLRAIRNIVNIRQDTEEAIDILIDLASLVVSAPVVKEHDKKDCTCSEAYGGCGCEVANYNQAIQADRILWSKVMLRLPEIIRHNLIGKGGTFNENIDSISDVIKKELGMNV